MAENLTTDDINPIPLEELPDAQQAPPGIFFVFGEGNGNGNGEIYFTDYGENSGSGVPDGWTEEKNIQGEDWSLSVVSGGSSGNILEITGGSTGTTSIDKYLFLNAVSDGERDNVDVYVRFRRGSGSAQGNLYLVVRGEFSTNPTAYVLGFQSDDDIVKIAKMINTTSPVVIDSEPFVTSTETWYRMRARINGNTLSLKIWADGDSEPESWTVTGNDSDISGVGSVGLARSRVATRIDVDIFSVATGGLEAPETEPVA